MRSGTRSDEGYVLLGIAIGLVIMGIFMAAAVPVWDHVIQRDREEELIWRGRQYVQAIERYQRKYPGAFPANMEVLVDEKFLRKAYEDPMAEEGEWRILRQNSPELRSLMAPGTQLPGQRADRRFRAPGRPGQPSRLGQPSQLGRRSMTGEALGGIVGVASASEKETIRIPGQKQAAFLKTVGEAKQYSEWLFVFQVAPDPTQPPGARGQRGRRGRPGQPGQAGQAGRPGQRPGAGPGRSNRPQPPGSPNPPRPRRP